MLHKIRIKGNKEEGKTEPIMVMVDGKEIYPKSVRFEHGNSIYPICEIEFSTIPDIEALAEIQISYSPKTVEEAVDVLIRCLFDEFGDEAEQAKSSCKFLGMLADQIK